MRFAPRRTSDDRRQPGLRLVSIVLAVACMSCTTTPSGSGAKTSSSPGPTREAEWARQYDGWEVVYDGVDTPADNVPNHLRWDNPIDDDWADRQTTFRPNQPVPGFLTVDRATRPEDRNRTGMIWRRDEALSFAAGLTIELRVRILPATTADAFFVTWIDDQGSGGVFLSPSTVKVGDAYPWNPGTTVGFDTSSDFHVYR